VNCALNYGYGVLRSTVERAVLLAGLDPYGGFCTPTVPASPASRIEPRGGVPQPVVDRIVVRAAQPGREFEMEEDSRLSTEARRFLATESWSAWREAMPHKGKKRRLRTIIQSQARSLAAFVRVRGPTSRS